MQLFKLDINKIDMEDSVKERLREFLKCQKIKATDFCIAIGVSSGFIAGMRESIQPDKLKSIAMNYPELNISWLMTGLGDMLNSQINVGDVKNIKGDISGNVATSGGQVINIPNFNGQKIIEPSGKMELCGDAQSEIEKLEIEKKALQQRIADLEKMLDMKDKLILMLENNFKNCE